MIELPVIPSNWIDEKRLLECIHCGLCLPACPTHVISGEEMPSPRGRLYLMRAVNEGRLTAEDPAFHEHEWSCLVCRACETACPSGVEFGYLMEQTRELLKQTEKRQPIKDFLYRRLLKSRRMLNVVQSGLAIVNAFGLTGLVRWAGRRLASIYPKLSAAMRLTPSGVTLPKSRPETYGAIGQKRGTAGLLLGCIGDAFTTKINDATIRVLTKLGYDVKTFPSVTCCGSLQIHGGYRKEGIALGKRLIGEVLRANPDFYISNIAGCGAMLKDYKELFHGTDLESDAEVFRNKTFDITEFLADRHLEKLSTLTRLKTTRVAYHAACHLYHAQKVVEQPLSLLSRIANVELFSLPENDLCCGSAGSYNIEHPVASEELLKRKMGAVEATKPDVIVTANSGCLMQLQKGIRERGWNIPVMHVIEFIDRSMTNN